ncbi:hypothetical protein TNIN_101601 [Trichonephila inaurata madagascariensis]|uniref:Uncharacterized protein n=1 Tax=Trichonephila inaurata madagascariensis TaxID=2747483 RepID=A0A8X6IEX2_9ARAC|nr:hypothetical protein TNIN_101601 [Trichonephila inaurata madagascariensis]
MVEDLLSYPNKDLQFVMLSQSHSIDISQFKGVLPKNPQNFIHDPSHSLFPKLPYEKAAGGGRNFYNVLKRLVCLKVFPFNVLQQSIGFNKSYTIFGIDLLSVFVL